MNPFEGMEKKLVRSNNHSALACCREASDWYSATLSSILSISFDFTPGAPQGKIENIAKSCFLFLSIVHRYAHILGILALRLRKTIIPIDLGNRTAVGPESLLAAAMLKRWRANNMAGLI